MNHYLVTGAPGTGKTRIGGELQSRGYHVIHGDEELIVPGAPGWWWDSGKLERRLRGRVNAFVVGGADNDLDFAHLFKKVFVLVADQATIEKRLTLQGVGGRKGVPKSYPRPVFIDSARSVRAVIFQILRNL